jgi:hypothetical protein
MFILLLGKSNDICRLFASSIIPLCIHHVFQFNPKVIHTDFEKACMKFMKELFLRKYRKLDLAQSKKNLESEAGNWFKSVFGIAFLSPEVEDSFA